MSAPRTVTVTLIRTEHPKWLAPWRRHQPWRWVATAANGCIMADSGESYANRSDCISAIEILFGPHTQVLLEEDGDPSWLLRAAQ